MVWVRGSVTVASNEAVSGSGQALALYNAIVAAETDPTLGGEALPDPNLPPTSVSIETWSPKVKTIRLNTLKSWARIADAIASVATYATANGVDDDDAIIHNKILSAGPIGFEETLTTIISDTIPTETIVDVDAWVHVTNEDGSESRSWHVSATFTNNSGGSAQLSTTTVVHDRAQAGAINVNLLTLELVRVSNTWVLRISGTAGSGPTTVKARAEARYNTGWS